MYEGLMRTNFRERGHLMHDDLISRANVIAGLLWAKSVGLVLLTWALAVVDLDARYHRALMLTGVLSIALASVWQIRVYALRVAGLIRVTSGLTTPDAEVRTVTFGRSERQ